MNDNQKLMWDHIANVIEPFCVNVGGFIRDHLSDVKTTGFCLDVCQGHLCAWVYKNDYLDKVIEKIEEPIHDLQYIDPPSTFEGMDENAIA